MSIREYTPLSREVASTITDSFLLMAVCYEEKDGGLCYQNKYKDDVYLFISADDVVCSDRDEAYVVVSDWDEVQRAVDRHGFIKLL